MKRLIAMKREAGLEDDEELNGLLEAYLLTNDKDLYAAAEARIKAQWAGVVAGDDPFAPAPEPKMLGSRGAEVGTVSQSGRPFYWSLKDDVVKGLIISGDIGSGKSNAAKHVATELYQRDCHLWFHDSRFEYEDMLRVAPDLLRIPWEELRFSVLKAPKNVPTGRWLATFADCFCHVFGLWIASSNFLQDCLGQLCEFYEDTDFCPTLQDLDLLLSSLKLKPRSKDDLYRDTIRDRTRAMVRLAGPIFACNTGFDLDQLAQGSSVRLDFAGCPEQLQQLLSYLLMHYIQLYRQYNPSDYPLLIHVLDESRGLIMQRKTEYVSDMDHLATRSRPFAVSYIYVEQLLSQVSSAITSNTRLKLVFNSQGRELGYAREILGLSWEQARVLRKLPVGTCVAVLGGERCPRPVLLNIPEFAYSGSVSKQEVEEWTARSLNSLNKSVTKRSRLLEEYLKRESESYLSTDESRLLRHVNLQPFLFTTQRREQLKLSWRKMSTALNKLERKGFIQVAPVNLGRKGKPPKLIELRPKAHSWLKQDGEPITKLPKGGIVHAYWCWRIAELFKGKGYKADLEAELKSGVYCDCLASKDGEVVAIEVECSSNGLRNAEKYASFINFVDQVIVAVDANPPGRQKQAVQELNRGINAMGLHGKVEGVGVRDLLHE